MKLTEPLWPKGRLNLTTPLHLLLVAVCVVGGGGLYARGYTYEGSAIVYMLGGVALCWRYYAARYTPWMTFLVLGSLVPTTIWLQNKAVEVGLWGYPENKRYLLWLTREGEGWWRWTRHLWLGNDMPAMEYLFYPLFGLFHVMAFALYSHLLPDRWFEEAQPKLRRTFWWIMTPVIAVFVAVYFLFPNPNATDYSYWMMGSLGFAVTAGGWFASAGFRAYTQSPAFWLWAAIIGLGFMVPWEFFHACVNRDWVYNTRNTFPAMYSFNDSAVPFTELFGYLTTATTFQALMLYFVKQFGGAVIRDPRLVPFSRL